MLKKSGRNITDGKCGLKGCTISQSNISTTTDNSVLKGKGALENIE